MNHTKMSLTGDTDWATIINTIYVIIAGIIVAAFFIARQEFKIKKLESHPLLKAFDKVQETQTIDAVENMLRNWRREER